VAAAIRYSLAAVLVFVALFFTWCLFILGPWFWGWPQAGEAYLWRNYTIYVVGIVVPLIIVLRIRPKPESN
jgi:hypothetical protein